MNKVWVDFRNKEGNVLVQVKLINGDKMDKKQILEGISVAEKRLELVMGEASQYEIDKIKCSIPSNKWYEDEYLPALDDYGNSNCGCDTEECIDNFKKKKHQLAEILFKRKLYWMEELSKLARCDVKEVKEKKVRTIRDLKDGDDVYYFDDNGSVDSFIKDGDLDDLTNDIAGWENCFLTKEEVEAELKYRKLRRLLQIEAKIAWGGEEINWKNDQQGKYYMHINKDEQHIPWYSSRPYQTPGAVYFPSSQSAREAVKKHRDLFDLVYDTKKYSIG